MLQIKKTRVNQDIDTVIMIGAVPLTGVVMMLSALNGSSFLAFWAFL